MSPRQPVRPAVYQPPREARARRRVLTRALSWLAAGTIVLAAGAAWFVFTARAVTLDITPKPATVAIKGGLDLPLGGRYLLRPGHYTVVAAKPGYKRLSRPIKVTADGDPSFRFALEKRPGRLRVDSTPAKAVVAVDGKRVGRTPLAPIEVAPGEHKITLRAKRYQVLTKTLTIEGKGKLQGVDARLTPAWSPIEIASKPAGATLWVDGKARGTTPVTARIGAGAHTIALRLAGYQPWQDRLEVAANTPQTLAPVHLARAAGHMRITSDPAGARVSVDGDYRGTTPLTVDMKPGAKSTLKIAKAGYRSATRSATVASAKTERWAAKLEPVLGQVHVGVVPASAIVYVDGGARGAGSKTLALTATRHTIAVRKPGYIGYQTEVTPKPDAAQKVTARLSTRAQGQAKKRAKTIESPAGGTLALIPTGHFTMGAPRREQGARANEVRRDVTLTRAFYLATHEVTNEQFRKFRDGHSSGIVARQTLDNYNQPVVRVSWDDATAYCNWLSKQAGLPAAYRDGQLVTPVDTGYRLPTEAEWAWAARFAGSRHRKYAWGDSMPPSGAAGNYADVSAADLVSLYLHHYDDGYAAAAAVGRFAPDALGLFDIGGNVSEWVNDRYSGGIGLAGDNQTDPTGPATGSRHVVRGASWRDATITALRLSYRQAASGPSDDLGFRVARYAE